jgi:transcriptional regulator with XRE-family HTH domain
MQSKFDKRLMFDNIAYLIKENDMKVGEVESQAGVSAGYISRTSKDGGTKPGIDFIVNISRILKVSLDVLLSVDLEKVTPTEKYLIDFIDKLISDTAHDKLSWNKDSAETLNYLECDANGNTDHPLFHSETFMEPGEAEYPEEVTRNIFISNTFDVLTYIAGNCYSLNMKNGAQLYLMNVSKSVHAIGDKEAFAKEIWMKTKFQPAKFLCSTRSGAPIADMVESLYTAVEENSKHPKIDSNLQEVIDAFMQDDLSDDDKNVPY